ncbi:MAG: ABC transporter permease [Vulcanimicrobiaceae bacterium]
MSIVENVAIPAKSVSANRKKRAQKRLFVFVCQIAVAVIAIAIWQLCASLKLLDTTVISNPRAVFSYLAGALVGSELWLNFYYTMVATLVAFVAGSVLGIIAGLAFVQMPVLEEIFDPFVTLLNAFPRIALAPLFIVWFGIGIKSKIILAISVIFFILLLTTVAGGRSVDRNLLTLCRSLGARPWKIFRSVTLPTAAPSIFAGLKLGLIYSFLGVIVGEMIASEYGLGEIAMKYSNTFQMDKVLGILFFLAVITTLLSGIMTIIEKRAMRWQKL